MNFPEANLSIGSPPLLGTLITVDSDFEEQQKRRQLLTTLLFYAHLFLLVSVICLFCWVRTLRRSGCLTENEANALLERTTRTLGHPPTMATQCSKRTSP